MTKLFSSMEKDGGTVPIACTLTTAALAAQASRWEQLAARAMTERTETAHGLRLAFRPEPGVEEELRALVAVETECCAWADWIVEMRGGQIVLDIRAAGDGITTLHGMFTGLHVPGPADPVLPATDATPC
jgi:hypothetical protein